MSEMGAFEKETLYRMIVEAARFWVIEHHQRTGELPEATVKFVYPSGPSTCLD